MKDGEVWICGDEGRVGGGVEGEFERDLGV